MISKTSLPTTKSSIQMFVTKRDGTTVPVSFDKILRRLQILAHERTPPLSQVNVFNVAKEVCSQIYDHVTTEELDIFSATVSSSMSTTHPEYLDLASRIVISNHQKKNKYTFVETMTFFSQKKTALGETASMVSQELIEFVTEHSSVLENAIDYERDYDFTYFGFCTLEKSYLLKTTLEDKVTIVSERPQHLWMRVAIGLYGKDLKNVLRVYDELSRRLYIHATPTLFNAGTPQNQLASCFLLGGVEDSIEGIFKSLGQCAQISKYSGGIGMNIHDIRSKGMPIHGTNGSSNGIVPMLRVFNDTARYVDQGGGKRNGSFAVYIEPWHPDILDFLNLRKNHGDESMRARDLFYALWIPDLFMKRVGQNQKWTLMDPSQCPGLADCFGETFDELYTRYEKEGRGLMEIDALELFKSVVTSQRETGTPYMLYKDSCNSRSNQQNLGTIRSSNLCTEIIEYSSKDETAVCNLASISLPAFLERKHRLDETDRIEVTSIHGCFYCDLTKSLLKKLCLESGLEFEKIVSLTTLASDVEKKAFIEKVDEEKVSFPFIVVNGRHIGGYTQLLGRYGFQLNYEKLVDIAKSLTRNLNQAIDRTFYPTPLTRCSNLRHRPIGIGVQGLADVFMAQRVPFDSDEAKEINRRIFESIYFGAMTASLELAIERDEAVATLKASCPEICDSRRIYSLDFWKEEVVTQKKFATEEEKVSFLKDKEELLCRIAWDKDVDWKEGPTGAYSSFQGSPLSQGKFQFDMWPEDPFFKLHFDWESLRSMIVKHGVRNSLLIAPMPTASTASILGNNECFEPVTANIYLRRTLAGEFVLVNKYLIEDLTALGLWNSTMKDQILVYEGSIQGLSELPETIKKLYKTVWEISQKVIIDMAAERGRFICQSQSMNLFLASPTTSQLISMHFYAWKKGLKTGMYYLRTKPASKATMATLSAEKYGSTNFQLPSSDEREECMNCSA